MDATALHEQFVHVRVIVGIITGLSIARLLNGLGRFVQHPDGHNIYIPHVAWTVFMILAVVRFWWYEFYLSQIPAWSFQFYVQTLFYASLFFFICSLLFPDQLDQDSDYETYFHGRQAWFYGLLALMFVADIADAAIKGPAYLTALGPIYPFRQGLLILMSLTAIFVKRRGFHTAFALTAVAIDLVWIAHAYATL